VPSRRAAAALSEASVVDIGSGLLPSDQQMAFEHVEHAPDEERQDY